MAKRTVIFPGSFDPLTSGHVDIVVRGLELFDKVIVAVLSNPTKDSLFTVQERLELIRHEFAAYKGRVEVDAFRGLLVSYAKKKGTKVIIRGLRAISDFDYEAQMALTNRKLSSNLETVFLATREEYSYISSTVVKQVARFGGDVTQFVPKGVAKALKKRFTTSG